MTENNAAQPGLTTEQILSLERRGNMTDDEALRFGRAIESALLSKLRAEGVQAGDERETFEEWDRLFTVYCGADQGEEAGKAAKALIAFTRAALASAPVAGEVQRAMPSAKELMALYRECETMRGGKGMLYQNYAHALLSRYAAPQASEAVRLDAPAQVGGVRFGKGIHWSTVISAAQRHHAFMNTPEKEAERIARAKEFVESIQADKDGECKPCNGMGFIDGVGDRCPACNGDGGDRAKGAGDHMSQDLDRDIPGSFKAFSNWVMNQPNDQIYVHSAQEGFLAGVEWCRQQHAALSPAPSVVKQSLTATQTGEKGESDAG